MTNELVNFIGKWVLMPIAIVFTIALVIDVFRGGRSGGSDRGGMDGGDGGF